MYTRIILVVKTTKGRQNILTRNENVAVILETSFNGEKKKYLSVAIPKENMKLWVLEDYTKNCPILLVNSLQKRRRFIVFKNRVGELTCRWTAMHDIYTTSIS